MESLDGIMIATTKLTDASDSKETIRMTQKELLNLVECYIIVEGYRDLRSILNVMSQEYPGEFDRKQAILAIRYILKANNPALVNARRFTGAIVPDAKP